MKPDDLLSIGALAERAGVATSALRFYESKGLIESVRTEGNQRRYRRATLRRVAVILAAQRLGLSLEEIDEALRSLPGGRTPTAHDWAVLSASWRQRVDDEIAQLERLRDELDQCVGCGCVSLKTCGIFNPGDAVGSRGPGAHYLNGEPREPLAGAN
jgi:MerR family redox-sensitive transcriptional activator SoxR